MEQTDAALIAAVLKGDTASFEPLVNKYSPRLFATARRYARLQSEVEDIVQEIWTKAYQKLPSFRGEAPFEHWLMRLAIHTCYDFLRNHQRNREMPFSDISDAEEDWLERIKHDDPTAGENAAAARELVQKVMSHLSPPARLVITLLEIEERSVKEISPNHRLVGAFGEGPCLSRSCRNAENSRQTRKRKIFVTLNNATPSGYLSGYEPGRTGEKTIGSGSRHPAQ